MNNQQRNDLIKQFIDKYVFGILTTKGKDYAGNEDANSNFKMVAERVGQPGVDKYMTWAVYFMKHLMSIETWLRTRKLESEPLITRIADAVNYLLILMTMLAEDGIISWAKESYSSAHPKSGPNYTEKEE